MAQAMRRNLPGGPSIVFHRCQIKGQTHIRGNGPNNLQTITGFDVNALYLWCTGLFMSMGKRCVYRFNEVSNKMQLSYDYGMSEKQIPGWLIVHVIFLTCVTW